MLNVQCFHTHACMHACMHASLHLTLLQKCTLGHGHHQVHMDFLISLAPISIYKLRMYFRVLCSNCYRGYGQIIKKYKETQISELGTSFGTPKSVLIFMRQNKPSILWPNKWICAYIRQYYEVRWSTQAP